MEENQEIKVVRIIMVIFIIFVFFIVITPMAATFLTYMIITNEGDINALAININSKGLGIGALIILGVIILLNIVSIFNKIIKLKQKVKQAASGIDVYLKQRFDLIPNIVETVKGYAKYEKEVLDNIIEIRSSYENIKDDNIEKVAEINNKYTKMLAIIEAYPELKANKNFLKLQKILSKIESQLQAARRIYNSEVTIYNIYIMSFPKNIIAKIFKFKVEKLFEIEAFERENIKVKL